MVPLKRIAAWGLAWGIGVTMLEQLLFTPIDDWGSVGFLLYCFFPWLLPAWCAIGAAFVWLVARRGGARGRREMLCGWLAVAAFGAIGQQLLVDLAASARGLALAVPRPASAMACLLGLRRHV
jgi:hypothetical protein